MEKTMQEEISVQVDLLTSKDTKSGCAASGELLRASRASAGVYMYFDEFLKMTDHKNSYVRTRGLLLICANARWDQDNKINANIARILCHITDPKPITSRQFIQALPELVSYKKELGPEIKEALSRADVSGYADSMRHLVEADIRNAIVRIEEICN